MKIHRKYKIIEFFKATVLAFTALAAFHPVIFETAISWTVFITSIILSAAVAGNAGLPQRDKIPLYAYAIHYAGIAAAFYTFQKWELPVVAACFATFFMSVLAIAAAGQQRNTTGYYNSPSL